MAVPFQKSWRPVRGYWPTQPLTGAASDTILRGQNLIMRGGKENVYCEQFAGVTDLEAGGTLDSLTGTVATTSGSATLTGTSTKFLSELIIGQLVLVNNRIYVITAIASNTSATIEPSGASTASGITAYFCRQIQEVDIFRGTFVRGSVIRLAQGHLLGVGYGQVRLNGSGLPGTALTLKHQVQIAILDNGSGDYTPYTLGMHNPTETGYSVSSTSGGSKNMLPGTYGIRIVPARMATGGFNNPSSSKTSTLSTAGDRVTITFPAMDTGVGQDAWRVYVTLYTTAESNTGPWYYLDTVSTTQVSSGGGTTLNFEWRDAEVSGNDVLEFTNDAAPAAAFVASLGGIPVLISCNGMGHTLTGTIATTNGSATVTGTSTTFTSDLAVDRWVWLDGKLYRVLTVDSATSMTVTPTPTATASGKAIRAADEAPGPVIRPAKPYLGGFNIEAFPGRAGVAVNPPETIIGYVEGMGRLYLLTQNRLHIASLTGDPDVPITTRPFWKVGFKNPRACVFVNGTLYAFTTNGATRSAGEGDNVEEDHEFAAPVASVMATWFAGKVTVSYDPKNESVCFMHNDDSARVGGTKRCSVALLYSLRLGVWSTVLKMEDTTDTNDTWSTSVATVGGLLYVLAASNSGSAWRVWSWDTGGALLGEVWAASPFMDMEAEGQDKDHEGISMTAHGSSALSAQIYGAGVNEDVPLASLEAGTSSDSGSIPFTPGSSVRIFAREEALVLEKRVLACRILLSTSGNNSARLDEVVMDGKVTKFKY